MESNHRHAKSATESSIQRRFDWIFRLAGTGLIVVGIFLVVQPFLSALLVAGVLAIATWPVYTRIRKALGGNSTWGATVMLLLILGLAVIPISLFADAVGQQLPALTSAVKSWSQDGVRVPEQLKSVPLVGERAYEGLNALLTDSKQLAGVLQKALEPVGKLSLTFVKFLGDGIVQLLLVAFIVFFYYRNGDRFVAVIRQISQRLSGQMSNEMLSIITDTTRSVFIGLVGTAAAQGAVAFIGFLIAGVPGAFLLAVGTFVLSVVPMGPVLFWGGAAVWLYAQGETGWAIFMVIWGAVVISSIDNFLKPLLIARGSTLSLGLIFLGVLGGVIAFGFIGVILGPVSLALGISLGRAWMASQNGQSTQVNDSTGASHAETPRIP